MGERIKTATTVAVVEDNADLNDLIVEELTAAGMSAVGFRSAGALFASDVMARVYLLDLNLPDLDGLELARKLREADPSNRIVMLTARGGVDARVAGYNAGASAYIEKPCSAREIMAAVLAQLSEVEKHGRVVAPSGQQDAPPSQELSENAFRLTGRLFVGPGGSVRLTDQERDLLLALIRSPSGLSYAAVASIFAPEGDMKKSTVEVRITRLRAKIAAVIRGEAVIQSIRNFGYALQADITLL